MTESQTNNNSKDDTKKCFTTRKDVLSSIYSEEKTNELIRLFSSTGQKKQHVHEYSHLDSSSMSNNDNGGTNNNNIYSVYHFYTGGKFMSAADSGNRSINAAFWILNAVRDACRDYLSFSSSSSSLSSSENHHYTNLLKVEEPQRLQDIYDSQFPSLSSNLNNQTSTNHNKKSAKVVELSSSSVKQKKNMVVKKHKRRIRPLVSPNNNVTGATSKATGNIASLPSEDASSMRSIMLEHKPPSFPATRKKKTSSVHSNKKKITPSIIANNNINNKSKSISEEEQKEKTVKTIIEPIAVKENKQKNNNNNKQPQQVIYEPYKPQLEHLVRLYVAIIQNSLVPSTSIELHLLLCCLSVKSSATRPHSNNNNNNSTSSTASASVVGSTAICFTEFIPLFNKGKIVSNFASSVLKQLKPIIMSFDDPILEAMTTYAPLHLHLPEIISEIKTEREKRKKNENNIHEKSPSVRLNEESSSFPIIPASNNNMSVPFHTHRDSRLNYRSASQSKIYNNREECRDSFFARLRHFQASYTKLSSESTTTNNNNNNKTSSNTTTKLFLSQKLMPKNLYWFTEFFCDLLSKKGLEKIQETDAEILSFCKGNEKKLQKLHQRIMEAPIQAGRRNGKKSSKTPHHGSHQTTTSLFNKGITSHHHPDSYFHGNQEFFYDFIKSADSHVFAQQLMRQLAGKIHSTCVEMSQQVVNNNTNNNNTQRHAIHQQLKIQTLLAKFLGMLAFSPNWNLEESSSTAAENSLGSVTNVAYVSSSIAAVRHLDATCPVIPIQEYILSAYENKCLTVILPWIISFLQMIKWDIISQSSCYYKRVFQLLRSIQKKLNLFIFNNNKEKDKRHSSNQCCVTPLMIIFEIETFLSESIGLDKIEYLPLINIDELITDKNEKRFRSNEYYDASHLIPPMLHGIDDFLLPIKVLEPQLSFFSSTGSQLTELYDLLMSDQLSQSDGKNDMVDSSSSSVITGNNKTMISGSRKMRPSQVAVGSFSSSSTSLESSGGDGNNNTSSSSTSTASGGLKPLSSSSLKATYSSVPIFPLESEACYYYSNIQLKLVSSFFQHHPELHSISEFVMKSCMKKMYLSSIDGIMKPQIKLNTGQFVKDEFESMSKILQVRNNNGSGSGNGDQKKDTKVIDDHNDVWSRLVEKIKQDSLNAIEDFLETECRKCIPPAIQLLVPPSIAEQDVLDMAIELSVQHAKKEGTKMIKSIVYFEVEKHTHCYLSENRVEIESTIKSHKEKRDGGEASL